MHKFFYTPFASTGDKTPLPDAVDPGGNVSYAQGYGPDYQRQKIEPAAKNIERDKMNQVFFDMTTAISELQSLGVPEFITPALNGGAAYPYEINALVRYAGEIYLSLVSANVATPSDPTKWRNAFASTAKYIQQLASGAPLPTANKGVIWHDDYQSLMTWQSFVDNGANYVGYASVLIGSPLADSQPMPRLGYVKSGTQNLSRTAYAALRGWAMHTGSMVDVGVWKAGEIAVADNADGTTFRIFDVRGEFPRYFDNGRGVDAGRVFGSYQKGSLVVADYASGGQGAVSLAPAAVQGAGDYGLDAVTNADWNWNAARVVLTNTLTPVHLASAEWLLGISRPRNVALLACIKY